MDASPTPLSAKRAAPDPRRAGRFGLEIRWSDGRASFFPWGYLRDLCPCAQCRPELVDKVARGDGADAKDAPARQVAQLQHVGHYALGVRWNDGHESILPWDWLARLDPESPLEERLAAARERAP